MTPFVRPFLVLTTIAVLVSACAPLPRSIPPVAVSARDFDPLSCSRLQADIQTNTEALAQASEIQRGAAIADVIGLVLIFVPPTLLTGDKSVEIAVTKGNDIAMRRAFEQKSCIPG